ncbi:3-keto-disaccharide hydrolase [Arsenicibacter rosenii]|uniref:3-keto-alpha-glucoside-1,2-lyase/3-keto-2-hydroxy-glucal hydratase domain-containing protein n=1 Tax=Arsenicibacter rosenii TaxID=1750698 RepID=A0A1S2VIS4_9BACT|nr:DUF1080 domain-containing protein [Arsenicibacter rosenii]OIN58654.1 hypothetical protein BLX24_13895 [Arsenicibacter rosenii]
MIKTILFFLSIPLFIQTVNAQSVNTLTTTEKKDGWVLLFNGKNKNGWHSYGKKGTGLAWIIDDNALKLHVPNRAGNKAANGGDIVTDAVFAENFEFKADWKVSRLANSGIFFFVTENAAYPNMHDTGLELQVLDDAIYEGARENTHRAGDFFGVANARLREVNPAGEWNQVHVIVYQNKLTVKMNGFTIQEHDLNSDDWKNRIAASGLKNAPLNKHQFKGRIGLQDWGSTVWYRNIKYRPL